MAPRAQSAALALLSLFFLTAPLGAQEDLFPDGSPVPEWFHDSSRNSLQSLGKCYVITDYGVKRDSTLVQTEALQAVINLAAAQGGVIASMTAGCLAGTDDAPKALALLAPGAVIKEACQGGKFFNARFDPKDPPEYVRCWGLYKLGREYLLSTQDLDIYGTASAYKGDVLILHGTRDSIVPLWCSERYKETYGDKASFKLIDGENHSITRRRSEVVSEVVEFFRELFVV